MEVGNHLGFFLLDAHPRKLTSEQYGGGDNTVAHPNNGVPSLYLYVRCVGGNLRRHVVRHCVTSVRVANISRWPGKKSELVQRGAGGQGVRDFVRLAQTI